MKKLAIVICLAAVAALARASWAAELEERVSALEKRMDEAQGGTNLRTYWQEGLRLDSADGKFKLKIGGRLQMDWAWFSPDDELGEKGSWSDGFEFRRARLNLQGDIYGNIGYRLEMDFAGTDDADKSGKEVLFTDAYLDFKGIPLVQHVQVGQFYEQFCLDELTSDNYSTFIEKALLTKFAPGRQPGIGVGGPLADNRATWALGAFRMADKNFRVTSDDGYAVTGRATCNPWYEGDGSRVAHVGVAYSHQTSDGGSLQFKQRPELHMAPEIVQSLKIDPYDTADRYGFEAAGVFGPFSVQGEYIGASVDGAEGQESINVSGYYVQASYFLTGEHRNYDRKSAAFSRVKPKKNWSRGAGWGAWEVAARYSNIDLSDANPSDPSEMNDVTLGLNWYANPNVRVMLDYVHTDVKDLGEGDMFGTRFQVDF